MFSKENFKYEFVARHLSWFCKLMYKTNGATRNSLSTIEEDIMHIDLFGKSQYGNAKVFCFEAE